MSQAVDVGEDEAQLGVGELGGVHFGMYSRRFSNSPGWWPARLSAMNTLTGSAEMSRMVTLPLPSAPWQLPQ